ncbi:MULTISPECIES: hypothetical protein [Streptomyces]|uniref:hypothetical protein n=1 Tax=Streptomyces TaxID=1883 RepID=UPI00068A8CD4|nr:MULTISPECIES: hypothetical protein [Streptomyces]RPK87502.1 hypothetical protein EES46_19400 [Streptomyces sp. ADI98-10]
MAYAERFGLVRAQPKAQVNVREPIRRTLCRTAPLVWWLAGQALSGGRRWAVLPGTGPVLRRRAWERAMTTQVAAFDGVARARVRLAGRPLRAMATVVVEPGARPAKVVREVAGVVADARAGGGLSGLPADVTNTGREPRGAADALNPPRPCSTRRPTGSTHE